MWYVHPKEQLPEFLRNIAEGMNNTVLKSYTGSEMLNCKIKLKLSVRLGVVSFILVLQFKKILHMCFLMCGLKITKQLKTVIFYCVVEK